MKEKLDKLTERAKELACLYQVEEVLSRSGLSTERILYNLLTVIPEGWRYPGICHVRINVDNRSFSLSDFEYSKWFQSCEIKMDEHIFGNIQVYYTSNFNKDIPFLDEELRLLQSIARKIASYLYQQKEKEKGKYFPIPSEIVLDHAEWRMGTIQSMVNSIDYCRYGIKEIYLIGSVKDENCGPSSDIDIIVYFTGDLKQLEELKAYVAGWSDSLAHQNYKRTGHKTDGLIDLHIVTDEDLMKKTSYAVMINHPDNLAKKLKKQ